MSKILFDSAMSKILFDIAYGIVADRIDYSGISVPAELVAAVVDTLAIEEGTGIRAARLLLQAMVVQRAVDLRLRGDDDDFSDCA